MKPSTVSTSSETNQTVSSFNAHSLRAEIVKTLSLNFGNDINNGTIAPSTRRAFFKRLHNIFFLYSKKILYEQYYRLHISGLPIAICQTNSSNLFVIDRTSFEQNNFYFLHALQEAVNAFNSVLHDFGFSQKLETYGPKKHPTQLMTSPYSNNYQPGFP